MGLFLEWLGANWFDLLQTSGIVAGLFFTGRSFLLDTKIRKITHLLSITEHHRSIWEQVFERPSLLRILDKNASLRKAPPSLEERIFVNLIILHLTAVMTAIEGNVHKKPSGQDEDLRDFFNLPIPKKVWRDTKRFREPEVVAYLDGLLSIKPVRNVLKRKPRLRKFLKKLGFSSSL